MIRAIVTFVVLFFALALLFSLFGWAGSFELLLLLVVSAVLTVAAGRFLRPRRPRDTHSAGA